MFKISGESLMYLLVMCIINYAVYRFPVYELVDNIKINGWDKSNLMWCVFLVITFIALFSLQFYIVF